MENGIANAHERGEEDDEEHEVHARCGEQPGAERREGQHCGHIAARHDPGERAHVEGSYATQEASSGSEQERTAAVRAHPRELARLGPLQGPRRGSGRAHGAQAPQEEAARERAVAGSF